MTGLVTSKSLEEPLSVSLLLSIVNWDSRISFIFLIVSGDAQSRRIWKVSVRKGASGHAWLILGIYMSAYSGGQTMN